MSEPHAAAEPVRTESPHGGSPIAPLVRPLSPHDADRQQPVLVGSLFWTLERGEQWVLGVESAFLFRDCWRHAIAREAWMREEPATRGQMVTDALRTVGRRWISGEPFLLDLYVAERDGAELAISSDEVGGNLYLARVDAPLVCRKSVYFGSQVDVMLRVTSPLFRDSQLGRGRSWRERLKLAAYGPGWILQHFVPRPGDRRDVVMQIDGDAYVRGLEAGETLRMDPRHAYAWDESVSYGLVEFGTVLDRLLRGSVPFQVEFIGPGRVWLSDMSFSEGYLGEVLTPSHWVYRLQHGLRRLLSLLNPFNWF